MNKSIIVVMMTVLMMAMSSEAAMKRGASTTNSMNEADNRVDEFTSTSVLQRRYEDVVDADASFDDEGVPYFRHLGMGSMGKGGMMMMMTPSSPSGPTPAPSVSLAPSLSAAPSVCSMSKKGSCDNIAAMTMMSGKRRDLSSASAKNKSS